MFFRKFIILNKQGKEDVKGHARLEVRGNKARLSLSLEGVKTLEDTKYRASFSMNEENAFKEISLGIIDVNKSGRGKLDISFNPKSVNESKVDINNLNILNISRENTQTRDGEIVLGGYIHREDDSLTKLMARTNKEKSQVKKELAKAEVASKNTEEDLSDIKGNLESVTRDKEIKKQEVPTKVYVKKDFKKSEDVKEETEETEEIEETSAESIETSSNDYSQQVAAYTLDVLESFKQIQPFKEQTKNQRWWKITPSKAQDQRGFLPYHNYILNPPCQRQVNSYNNYLFGVAESEEKITHYIYGIPGRYKKSEHPYEGKTGFITWLEDKEETGNGYWLSYIDISTGNVVRPLTNK